MPAFRFTVLLVACLALPQAATADPAVDMIVEELKTQGFERIEISRTFLGRHRIVATTSTSGRELVINGGTGSVVRDRRFAVIDSDDDRGNDHGDDVWIIEDGPDEGWVVDEGFDEDDFDGHDVMIDDDFADFEEFDDGADMDFSDVEGGETW